MKYVFIVNPVAGNDNKAKIFSRIKSTFRLIDDEMIVEPTHAQGEAKLIAEKYAAQYGSDCVIVSCGGDGARNCKRPCKHGYTFASFTSRNGQ